MPEPEFGTALHERSHHQERKTWISISHTGGHPLLAIYSFLVFVLLLALAGHCAHVTRNQENPMDTLTGVDTIGVHQFDRRGAGCNETDLVSVPSVESVTPFLSDGAIAVVTQPIDERVESSIPISTQTTTLYTVLSEPQPTVDVETTTITTLLVVTSEFPRCSIWNATLTVTVTAAPTPTPQDSSSLLGDATMTGAASTITDLHTDVSYTSGLPDVTISGNPATVTSIQTDVFLTSGLPDATVPGSPTTVTSIQTDVSFTSGLPDATVPGSPATVTSIQTDISVTSGLPDATISGSPMSVTVVETNTYITAGISTSFVTVVISDLFGNPTTSSVPTSVAITAVDTKSLLTTLTITDAYPPTTSVESSAIGAAGSATSGASQTVVTEIVTATNGEAVTVTTTVLVPFQSVSFNNSVSGFPTGTGTTATVAPSTPPVVISVGSKIQKPYWAVGNFGCFTMIAAAIMLLV